MRRMTNGPALPPEAPIAMPRQPLNTGRQPRRRTPPLFRRIGTTACRLSIFATTGALTAYGTFEMYAVTAAGGVTLLQWLFLAAFSLTFAWIGFSACQAIGGFIRLMYLDLSRKRRTARDHAPMRTAVLLPIYNEDPVPIAAGVRAMADGLAETSPDDFAFFVLSDTTDPEAWVGEQAVFSSLIDVTSSGCPVFYRHRRDNRERKAGNIADWVTRWGGAYDAMIVLDADSLMAPDTMIEMRDRLSGDTGLGLIQTLPGIVGGNSLFARLQQFANRCYGPIFGNGLAAWHGNDGNFWGHNAIIRIAAFAACCRLPHLAGDPPFGGHILSHDFVEAALLRRAGWGVRFDTDLNYSYEEAPPSLTDVMIRDRRWCQGNLQHSRVLTAAGIPAVSRVHMLSGIFGYLSAPLWMLLVAVGLALAVQVAVSGPDYFPGPTLFPIWPVFESARAVELFALSMGVLLTPKFLGWLAAMINLRRCRRFGGPLLLTLGVVAEIVLSALYAPVLMLVQSHIVWQILRGGDSGWQPQRRADGGMPLRAAFRTHFRHTVIGLATALGTWTIDSGLFLWTLPLSGALILSPVTSWLSGSTCAGRTLRDLGIFQTPEERGHDASGILARRQACLPWAADMQLGQSALSALSNDPDFNAWHCCQLDPRHPLHEFNPALFVARAKAERERNPMLLSGWLMPEEKQAFLHDIDLVEGLLGAEPQLLQA